MSAPMLLLGALLACGAAESAPVPEAEPAAVVLLHGLGRSDQAMRPLERRLAAAGYRVHNLRYPSRELAPDELGPFLGEQLATCCAAAPRLHFVTHSLGGILVRAFLAERELPNLGRVVMLAPPSQGSEIVDHLGDARLVRWALGPTGAELGTDPESLPNRLPPPDFPAGVIAGTASINPLGSALLPGDDDGAVSVARTRLPGLADFITVPASHTWIMRSDAAGEQVLHFLANGRFRRDPQPAPEAP